MNGWFRGWWRGPILHGPGESERRVSWLELFYDLVFVVVVSQLAHALGAHPDRAGLLHFTLFFIPAWWVWIGGSVYSERFESYDLSYRTFIFLQMLAVGIMAASATGTGDAASDVYALGYAGARALITIMWWRAGRYFPVARPLTTPYTIGFSLSVALWVLSVWVAAPWNLVLRATGLLIDLVTPILTLKAQASLFGGAVSKLPERFGAFVLIVLGESLVGIVTGLHNIADLTAGGLLRYALGFAVGFGLWVVYFDFVGRRVPRPGVFIWAYLHLPLVMALAAVGGALAHVTGEASLPGGLGWLLAGAFALAYLCIGLLELTLAPENPPLGQPAVSSGLKLLTAVLALLTPLLGLSWAALTALVGLHLLNTGYGLSVWFRSSVGRENSDYH